MYRSARTITVSNPSLPPGTTNVVRSLKSSGLGDQVDQTDGVTIDIVAMLMAMPIVLFPALFASLLPGRFAIAARTRGLALGTLLSTLDDDDAHDLAAGARTGFAARVGEHTRLREPVEQRRLAGVGVADQRHHAIRHPLTARAVQPPRRLHLLHQVDIEGGLVGRQGVLTQVIESDLQAVVGQLAAQRAAGIKTRGNHTAVVHDEEVTGVEPRPDVAERGLCEGGLAGQ